MPPTWRRREARKSHVGSRASPSLEDSIAEIPARRKHLLFSTTKFSAPSALVSTSNSWRANDAARRISFQWPINRLFDGSSCDRRSMHGRNPADKLREIPNSRLRASSRTETNVAQKKFPRVNVEPT